MNSFFNLKMFRLKFYWNIIELLCWESWSDQHDQVRPHMDSDIYG